MQRGERFGLEGRTASAMLSMGLRSAASPAVACAATKRTVPVDYAMPLFVVWAAVPVARALRYLGIWGLGVMMRCADCVGGVWPCHADIVPETITVGELRELLQKQQQEQKALAAANGALARLWLLSECPAPGTAVLSVPFRVVDVVCSAVHMLHMGGWPACCHGMTLASCTASPE